MVEQTAAVDVADVLRRQFSQRLERYRSLVAKSVEMEGSLPPKEASEVAQLMEQLGLPVERFERDRASLIAAGNLERHAADILEANSKTIADVPALEAELEVLDREYVAEMTKFRLRREEMEREMAKRRQAITAERKRPRQSTAEIDMKLSRIYEGNPVMFRAGVTADELPRLLAVRQTIV
jgi:hypothetical protein